MLVNRCSKYVKVTFRVLFLYGPMRIVIIMTLESDCKHSRVRAMGMTQSRF